MLIPAVLAGLLVLVLVGAFLGGAFNKSGNLDKNALERVVLATSWRVGQTRDGSRDKTTLTPADGAWEIVLRTSERTGSRGTGGASTVFATGGSGTAWHVAQPAIQGLVAVAPGEPIPEGAQNDLLTGPAAAILAMALPRIMREITGGEAPAPARLISFRTGDPVFDGDYCLVTDDPELAQRLITRDVKDALGPIAGLKPSLVISAAGVQLAIQGDPSLDPAVLTALVEAGKRVQAALGAG